MTVRQLRAIIAVLWLTMLAVGLLGLRAALTTPTTPQPTTKETAVTYAQETPATVEEWETVAQERRRIIAGWEAQLAAEDSSPSRRANAKRGIRALAPKLAEAEAEIARLRVERL